MSVRPDEAGQDIAKVTTFCVADGVGHIIQLWRGRASSKADGETVSALSGPGDINGVENKGQY